MDDNSVLVEVQIRERAVVVEGHVSGEGRIFVCVRSVGIGHWERIRISEHVLVVMAGRNEPADAWRTDPGGTPWYTQCPSAISTLRMGDAFSAAASAEARAADPVTERVWAHLEAQAPLRSDERASRFRFWMARDTGQEPSPVQSLIFIR